MRSSDTLELPEVSLVKFHRLGVSTSQALGQVGVVKGLAISELLVAKGKAKTKTEHESASGAEVVDVEVLAGTRSLIVGE